MKSCKAFTLIELLVVISIIALLVSILMPALSNARQQATGAVCLANQKTMALAWVMYCDENDGRLPWSVVTKMTAGSPGQGGTIGLLLVLSPGRISQVLGRVMPGTG